MAKLGRRTSRVTNAVRLPARHALPLEDKEQEEYKDKRKDGVRFLARGYTHARAITPSQGTSGLSEMTDSDWLWTPSQASLPSHCRIDPGGCASAAGTSEIRPGPFTLDCLAVFLWGKGSP